MIALRKILVPTDFSNHSACAVEYAIELADKFEAELHLLHVLETRTSSTTVFAGGLAFNPRVEESGPEAEAALAKVVADREAVRVTGHGPAALAITRYAEETDIDLIVMGTHGRSGLAHVVMGSVAERVVRQAPCPVLTTRLANTEQPALESEALSKTD